MIKKNEKTPEKNKGGRPTKYRPEFCQKADEYLKTVGKEQMHLPKIESFALFLDVNKDTLYEWAKKYPKFSDTLKKIKLRQYIQLVNDGVYGGKKVNATIVKLMLQNNHGMKERKDVTTGGKPIPIMGGTSNGVSKD